MVAAVKIFIESASAATTMHELKLLFLRQGGTRELLLKGKAQYG
jgi:hypothetical protein